MKNFLLICCCTLCLSGCSWLRGYQPPIQQGNILNKDKMTKIHKGMSQADVKQLLGDPVLENTFNDNQLLYVYNFMPNGNEKFESQFILTFRNNQLIKIEKQEPSPAKK